MAYYKCGSVYTTQNSNVGINTASGDIASFQTNLAMALQKLKIAFSASQDLHGYSKPWIGGAGKNLLDISNQSASGTNLWFYGNSSTYKYFKAGTYTFSYIGNSASIYYAIQGGSNTAISLTLADGKYKGSFTLTENGMYRFFAQKSPSISLSDITYPQIESGSTATSFEPYENICPITGFSQANAFRMGKNLIDIDGQTITSQTTLLANVLLKKGKYTFSADLSNNTSIEGRLRIRQAGTLNYISTLSIGDSETARKTKTFTLSDDTYIDVIANGASAGYSFTFDNVQLEFGSIPSPYTPYHGNTYLLRFGDTYYGCEIDVVHGKLRVVSAYEHFTMSQATQATDLGNTTRYRFNLSNNVLTGDTKQKCNVASFLASYVSDTEHFYCYNVSETAPRAFVFLTNPVSYTGDIDVVYSLKTPIEIDLTPVQIATLVGDNNVFCDIPTSTVDLEYKVINL